MQQTLQQAVQPDVALQKCAITLHAALRAFLSTRVKNRLERENYIEQACSAASITAWACSTACSAVSRF
jgi:hypothetical protein